MYSPINQPKRLPAVSARCSPSAIHSIRAARIDLRPFSPIYALWVSICDMDSATPTILKSRYWTAETDSETCEVPPTPPVRPFRPITKGRDTPYSGRTEAGPLVSVQHPIGPVERPYGRCRATAVRALKPRGHGQAAASLSPSPLQAAETPRRLNRRPAVDCAGSRSAGQGVRAGRSSLPASGACHRSLLRRPAGPPA